MEDWCLSCVIFGVHGRKKCMKSMCEPCSCRWSGVVVLTTRDAARSCIFSNEFYWENEENDWMSVFCIIVFLHLIFLVHWWFGLSLILIHEPCGAEGSKMLELVYLRTLKFSLINKLHIFQCMGKIFCVEFQREPLKFHIQYLTQTLKDTIFIQCWKLKNSQI